MEKDLFVFILFFYVCVLDVFVDTFKLFAVILSVSEKPSCKIIEVVR